MNNKLHVGNLGSDVTDIQLRGMFRPYGSVRLAIVAMDQGTARSRGFGFVEMGTEQETRAAIAGMNGQISNGLILTVSEANPKAHLPVEAGRKFRRAPGDAHY